MFRSLKSVFVRDVILLFLAIGLTLLALIPVAAHAEGYTRMGLVRRIPISATAVRDTVSSPSGAQANDMAKAYLMYTTSGDPFWVRRNTITLATFETYSLKVPENEEAVLTPLQAVKSGDYFKHVFELVGTGADTLISIELWR